MECDRCWLFNNNTINGVLHIDLFIFCDYNMRRRKWRSSIGVPWLTLWVLFSFCKILLYFCKGLQYKLYSSNYRHACEVQNSYPVHQPTSPWLIYKHDRNTQNVLKSIMLSGTKVGFKRKIAFWGSAVFMSG